VTALNNALTLRNLQGEAVLTETVAGVDSFGSLHFPGGGPPGYAAIVDSEDEQSVRLILSPPAGAIAPVVIPAAAVRFRSSDERGLEEEDEPEWMYRLRSYGTPEFEVEDEEEASTDPAQSVIDPNAVLTVHDFYAPERVLALSANSFLLTSLKNGAVRYYWDGGSGGYRAERVLEAPIYRSWRRADGSFIAVGFELRKPAKRYREEDMVMSRVLTYDLN
jgi:hypothetical protein